MNLTPKEHFKLHGRLPERVTEDLIDLHERASNAADVSACLQEARAQFPSEDFLADAIERLHTLAKNLRGGNRETLLGIIESLDDVAQCTFNAADYGRSELKQAEAALKALNGP